MPNACELQDTLLAATAVVIAGAGADPRLDLPDLARAAAALADRGPRQRIEPHCPPRVCQLLQATRLPTDPDFRRLLLRLREAATALRWIDPYVDRPDQIELRASYFVTVLVDDPRRESSLAASTEASIFLTVQGPDIVYPPHSHLAPELYCAIAGFAEWKMGDGEFAMKPPGSWMVHPPWTSHAMRTGDEPLVALAVWTDDLDSSVTLDD